MLVCADRGLYAPWLYQAIVACVACGWHPFLRINTGPRSGSFQSLEPTAAQEATGEWALSDVLRQVGAHWKGRVVCFREHAVTCTLLARWKAGYTTGWVVLTDMDPHEADVAWYAMRTWIEAGFKDTKREGWQWQYTRMRDPDQVSCFWLVLAVATLWAVSVGSAAEDAQPPAHPEALPERHIARRSATVQARRRGVSGLRRGLSVLGLAWGFGQAWPTAPLAEEPGLRRLPASSRQKTYP